MRFIYVNRLSWYLTVGVGPRRDRATDQRRPDVNGWDLRKTLQLRASRNPTLLEWLRSPIVYPRRGSMVARLRALAEDGFSPRWLPPLRVDGEEELSASTCAGKRCATRSTSYAAAAAGGSVDRRRERRAADALC